MRRNQLHIKGASYCQRRYFEIMGTYKTESFDRAASHSFQCRPNEGLFEKSVTFKDVGVSVRLCNALQKIGFLSSTPIQKLSYPAILSGKDVVIGSETGSGKTLSYLLPLIDTFSIINESSSSLYPVCVILAPTKDLCRQIERMASELLTVTEAADKFCIRIGSCTL